MSSIQVEKSLLERARKLGGHHTNEAVVTEALTEYIQRREQLQVLDLFGKVEYDPFYDYKKQRSRRSSPK